MVAFLKDILGKERVTTDSASFVRRHPGLVLYLLITLFVMALYLNNASFFQKYEARIQDLLFKVREVQQPSGQVVMLSIDNKSLDHIGKWPWKHQRIAQLVEALQYYEPKVVVFRPNIKEDIDDYISGNTQLLAENILQSENVIITFEPMLASRTPRSQAAPDWLRNSALPSIIPFEGEHIPPAGKLDLPQTTFGSAARKLGFELINFDSDHHVRRQPMLVKYERYFYPSIELSAAALALGVPFDGIDFSQDEKYIQLNGTKIPVDEKGYYFVNYYGPPSTIPEYSVKDFWDGEIDIDRIKDKVIVVSLTAYGMTDELSTSLGDEYTPAELSATIIDNILSDRFIKPLNASESVELLVLLALGVLCASILPRLHLVYRYIVLTILGFVLVNFNYILFTSFSSMANTFYPMIQLVLFAAAAPLLSTSIKTEESVSSTDPTVPERHISASSDSREKDESTPQKKTPDAIPSSSGGLKRTLPMDSIEKDKDEESEAIETAAKEIRKQTGRVSKARDRKKKQTGPLPIQFGRYEVIEEVGEGAMGTVYKGKDPAIGRMVALKTIRIDKIADSSEVDELRERLAREAKAAGNLSHPNIVTIYDVGQDGDTQYIAMEYLEGHSLETVIKRKLDMNMKLAAQIAYQVCLALNYAHRQHLVHRDIKPGNIMVMENFHVKVMDFGIAHFESSNLTQTGIAMGTPSYISPEQLKGQPVTASSDIFSTGVVLYEILTGEKPFKGDSISNLIMKIVNEDPKPPSEINPKIPPMLDLIVKKALQKDPYNRYGTAEEMSRALDEFITAFSPANKVF